MNNKRLRALVGVGILSATMAFVNIADAATKYAKTTENLNFRTGPSTSNKIITTIKKNTQVEVISYEGQWAKIKYNNTIGYSSKSYLSEVNSSSSTNTKIGTVTADELNVRSGAGTNYSKIGSLTKGTKVTILSSSNGWYKIQYTSSKTGWVSGSYLKVTTTSSSSGSSSSNESATTTKTGVVTADELNVRSGAGTSYSKIGSLTKGTKVKILSSSNGWYKIQYTSSKTGWVSGSYINLLENSLNSGSSSSGNNNLQTTQPELPKPISVPTYVDAPVNDLVVDSQYDQYQDLLTVNSVKNNGLQSLSIKSNGSFGVNYSIYSNGSWKNASNGQVVSNQGSSIEGVRINLTNAPEDYHIFYRVKVANQGWQNWVKDNTISGEISVDKSIEDIEVRLVVSDKTDDMVKETIAIDLGHNVLRPTKGAINGIYNEDYLIREVTKQVVYKLRCLGYNVVETIPNGMHTQSEELKLRAKNANANEVDKFVSIHFNYSDTVGANGTEVYYAPRGNSKTLATNVSKNISNSFNFKNRGAKDGSNLAVLRNTTMPAILVEGCFLDQIDMDKFIAKGSSAYSIMAQDIIDGIIQ